MTHTEEDYIKALFHLGKIAQNTVGTNDLAVKLHTKPSSVTDMLRRLSSKGIVDYQPYHGARLSPSGAVLAKNIIRRHRLWEVFLSKHLGFAWDEVHELAEELEHIKSEKLVQQLDAFLGYPKYDPHGDPIPNARGELSSKPKVLLSELEAGQSAIFIGGKDSNDAFLQYLDRLEISLGASIKIIAQEPYDHSILIEVKGQRLTLSASASKNMYINI